MAESLSRVEQPTLEERLREAERRYRDAIEGRDDLPMAHDLLAQLRAAEARLRVAEEALQVAWETLDVLEALAYEEWRDGLGPDRAAGLLRVRSNLRAALGSVGVGDK